MRALIISIALSLLPQTGLADSTATETAKAFFAQGEHHYRLGEFDKALTAYRQALNITKRLSVIFNVAQCYRQLKNFERAIFYYKLYLSDWQRKHPESHPPNQAEVQGYITELRISLEKSKSPPTTLPAAKPSTGLLRISGVDVDGARITVGGLLKGIAPLTKAIAIGPGTHHLRVTAKGYLTYTGMAVVRAGKETQHWVKLETKPQKNGAWLWGGIGGALLAAGGEALAWTFYTQANDHYSGTESHTKDQKMVIAGHAIAGAGVALSALSLYFYFTSDDRKTVLKSNAASISIIPAAGGINVGGRIRF
jgi:tetratricopeptide (TPR) repeat protein